MGKFVLVHVVGKDADMEAMAPVAKAIKAASTTDAYWIRSTYLQDEGKLYCNWDAKDAEAIREVVAKVPACPPIEGIYAVTAVAKGEDYRS